MALGSRQVSDAISIMRRTIGRRNTTDPESSDTLLFSYINDFVSLSMSNDVHLSEFYGTLSFTIDDTSEDGIYTFNDVGASSDFVDISNNVFISLLDPENESTSWNRLEVFTDPTEFYAKWGINNLDLLTTGFPTDMLYYGNEFVFRTLPDDEYLINIYGYKKRNDFDDISDELPFDYLLRYIAYGAALNYAQDFNFSDKKISLIERGLKRERILLLTGVHNRIKKSRGVPNF